ncbi:hypothetical protein [Candidatus Mycoplasma haematohominis]|uniref:hypothetical protein n=1 Tax=Candidatus Mycoplasma haematohominis TaxID=1494318 RepID=UPI001C0A68DF|nr:hypothetical protein [Candidatus Mycoplasma haemohominis]
MTTAQKAVAGLATTGIIGGVSAAATKKSPAEDVLKNEVKPPEEQPKAPENKSTRKHFQSRVNWSTGSLFLRNRLLENIQKLLNNPSTRDDFLNKLIESLRAFHKDDFLKWGWTSLHFRMDVPKTAYDISNWCKSKYDLATEDEPDERDLKVFDEFCKAI